MAEEAEYKPPLDPDDADWYFFVFCSPDGTNDGSINDNGFLQGSAIASYAVTPETGLTVGQDNKAAVTIGSVAYGINTVVGIYVTSSTDYAGQELKATCQITTDDTPVRKWSKTIIIPVRESSV